MMPVEIYSHSNVQILWTRETPSGPILCRKEDRASLYFPEPHIHYWYEVPLQSSFIYRRDGQDRSIYDVSLGGFMSNGRLHLCVEQHFPYNIDLVNGACRERIYEPWFHFDQMVARCHSVLQQLPSKGKKHRNRAMLVEAILLALIEERGLDLDEPQVSQLHVRAGEFNEATPPSEHE